MSEKFKEVEIKGRTFRIKKFDALTGSFILIKITALLAPIISHLDLKKINSVKPTDANADTDSFNLDGIDIPGIASELGKLSEVDFRFLQGKSLRLCSESLPAGFVPILHDNGSFAVQNLDDDTMTVMALMVHALVFNVKGFFLESPLASLLGGLMTTSPRN